MKSVSDHSNQALFQMGGPIQAAPPSTEAPRPLIDRVFVRMTEMFGQKWLDYVELAGGVEQVSRVWAAGLASITGEEMRRGVGACLMNGKPWPPTLPEFRDMCRPRRDPEIEFERAAFILGCIPIDWKGDRVLYAAMRATGAFEVRLRPYTGATKARWERALREAEDNRDSLPAPPDPAAGLLTEKPTERSRALVILADLRNKLFGEGTE